MNINRQLAMMKTGSFLQHCSVIQKSLERKAVPEAPKEKAPKTASGWGASPAAQLASAEFQAVFGIDSTAPPQDSNQEE
jgi:hypothetical protein